MSNVKHVVAQPLTADNHALWRAQILKLFRANGYEGFLTGITTCPAQESSTISSTATQQSPHSTWILIDQNLAAALYSVISPAILPYVLSAEHCSDIWAILDHRLQSSTRSRISQIKNELYVLTMKDKTMSQYLLDVKSKVDALAAAGSHLDAEEVIHYTLNGLPSTYQAFKTAIRTNLRPVTLDELYTLLCSEELNLAHETAKELQSLQLSGHSTALTATRGRGRGRTSANRNRVDNRNSNPNSRTGKASRPLITSQICGKNGHSAIKCWHRHDDTYNTEPASALFTSPTTQPAAEWFLDSGASSHLASDPTNVLHPQPYLGSTQVTLGNGNTIPIHTTCKGILPTPAGSLKLSHLNLVLNLAFNLLSVHKLTSDNNCDIIFSSSGYTIKDRKTQCPLLTGPCINGLYPLQLKGSPQDRNKQLALLSIQHIPDLWHQRLGHPSRYTLATIAHAHSSVHISPKIFSCDSCKMAKSHRLPTSISQTIMHSPLYLIHSDVWGPVQTGSNQGYFYYVSFIDDFSKFTWVYPLIHKSDVFSKFIEFQNYAERQFSRRIHILRTDNGGEYINNKFKTLCNHNGIIHQTSCPHTPSQNGVAERKHRHLIETTRALLLQASVPQALWVDTLLTATYLINRLPSPNTHQKSPYKILFNRTPDYTHLRVFGCLCYPWLKPYSNNKLSRISTPCVFIGYPISQKGYRCLDPISNKVYTSCNVIFDETQFPFSNTAQGTNSHSDNHTVTPPLLLVPTTHLPSHLKPTQHATYHPPNTSSTTDSTFPTTPDSHSNTASITNTAPNTNISQAAQPADNSGQPTHHMITRLKSGNSKPKQIFDLLHSTHTDEPTTYTQAAKSEKWRQAMSQEFQALQTQGTWELVPPAKHQNILGCKWTFRTKYNSDGTVARYKARLVAKGYNQEHGIDYTETFSPVAKMPTVRILILIALHYNWTIHQLDVSNAFLHGSLSDIVYMQQPQGFQDALHPNYVCKLKKALYGLKQSPREWYSTLSNHLTRYGFTISTSDYSLLTYNSGNVQLYVLIYVDDILITGNSPTEINRLFSNLQSTFQMKNLGSLSQFLGIQTIKTSTGLLLHQQSYARKIIERAGMSNSKPVSTPMACKHSVRDNSNVEFSNPILYRQLVGSLQYLTLTRPDI
ncbi:Retrovirus-related Pol polyprotein from transposon TNT 1-94 [Dendrobium catenatum]|uniref:Retrovirus-related Pol polyprotein from transposon TNT 1-94 n=1 Tax=Dendrobium catenatum TaxID=906689 RepID=A0A2I0VNP1_9ASPA|nr:Retrovirus-related Pol polyprotein from transposon TNT 1-94 [Dendrobium catenatum]